MKYLIACDHLTQIIDQDTPEQAKQLSKCGRCRSGKVRAYAYCDGDENFISRPVQKKTDDAKEKVKC